MTLRDDALERARLQIEELSPDELASAPPAVLIDVRELPELAAGRLPGARHVPRSLLELRIEAAAPDREANLVLYCASGVRSLLAARALRELGYTRVRSLRGGFAAWRERGLPVEGPASELTGEQRARYSRHLLLPEIGEAGQAKLLAARVLVVGAGGLGSPAALYLAAAGVGTLGIVDDDRVEASNLQRQILHTTARVGQAKTASAREALRALNPDVQVEEHRVRLSRDNALDLVRGYDLVVDGTDSFATRYLINDACVLLGKPSVHAAVFRFDGQATTFVPGAGPCYRCLFPEAPPPELSPNCAEAGVLGVLPGLLGLVQATEALKLLVGFGEPLVGRLLLYDARAQRTREVRYAQDPECRACGRAPQRTLPEDDDGAACASPALQRGARTAHQP